MRKNVYLLAVLLTVMVSSCSRNLKLEFVKKYGDDSFSEFEGKSLYLRNVDGNNNFTYFFGYMGKNCSPFIINVKKETGEIISIDNKLIREISPDCDSLLNRNIIEPLIDRIRHYDVNLLQVDNVGNVFVNIEEAYRPNLIRVADSAQLDVVKGFKKLSGNWYYMY